MLSSTKRRISVLERSIQLPMTAERFLASVQDSVRLSGASLEKVFRSSLSSLSDENLDRLEEEVIQRLVAGGVDIEPVEHAANGIRSVATTVAEDPMR